jgi:glycosyltransferase involved in cell wall biosynthesis
MTAPPPRKGRPNGVLICGPWPHPRVAIFSIVSALIATLNRAGRSVLYLCEGFGFRDFLGPDAVCVVTIPGDEPFDWRAAFARKMVFPSLSAFLAEDRDRPRSLLAGVGILHLHLDKLVFESDHPENSKAFDRTVTDYLAARTGGRPLLVRTRYDDMQGNLDGFMRLTGIDYLSLDRGGRQALLGGAVDLAPVVQDHVHRHRDRMRSWDWGEGFIDEVIHHARWRLHQLCRWRHEITHFDAVVCLTPLDAEEARALLLCEAARNLTAVHAVASFEPAHPGRVDQLLHAYHRRRGLACYRGARDDREPVAFAPADQKILFVGRATRIKGCHELAESIRDLYHSGRRNIRGIFVGDFWPELRRQLAAVDPGHAEEYLLFTGPVYDVDVLAALYSFGDVTAIPSHYEPFALVGLESYQMGTPCVVTEGTGAAEAYLDNPRRHGLDIARPVRRLHRDGIERYYGVDVGSLTEQLAFLIDNPHIARQMAEDGRRFVQEHYSAGRMGAKYLELYDLLLAGGQPDQLTA